MLELALVQYAMQTLLKAGYTPVITPDGPHRGARGSTACRATPTRRRAQVYTVDTDLCLVSTAEDHRPRRDAPRQGAGSAQLPLKYIRSVALLPHRGRHRDATPAGLYRVLPVHQGRDVRLLSARPERGDHQELLATEEQIFQGLGLPYQVIDTCTGDLGGPAYRKYDLEAWMPGRGQGGEYGEVTSTSNCTDFQARRLNIRFKTPGQKGTGFVHTLNGTAVACTRALVALLENYQQADGSVVIPEVLRPWVGKDRIAR
ncbi:MAG: aminoacyl--tRNA ligase-related protein [Gemmataceae bacterium]